MELTKRDEGYTLKKSEHCYAVWKKKRRCENCISQEVLRTHKPQTKIETRESDIYYVLASFIEVDGRPYSLELVKRIKSDDMFDAKMCSTSCSCATGRCIWTRSPRSTTAAITTSGSRIWRAGSRSP